MGWSIGYRYFSVISIRGAEFAIRSAYSGRQLEQTRRRRRRRRRRRGQPHPRRRVEHSERRLDTSGHGILVGCDVRITSHAVPERQADMRRQRCVVSLENTGR